MQTAGLTAGRPRPLIVPGGLIGQIRNKGNYQHPPPVLDDNSQESTSVFVGMFSMICLVTQLPDIISYEVSGFQAGKYLSFMFWGECSAVQCSALCGGGC